MTIDKDFGGWADGEHEVLRRGRPASSPKIQQKTGKES